MPTIEPVYDADGITLYHGDCLEVMPRLKQPADAVFGDLPYATTKNHWDRMIDPKLLWHCWNSLLGDRSPIVLFGSGMFTSQMMASNPDAWSYNLIWNKVLITGQLNSKRQPLRVHEDLMVFYRRQPTYNPQMVFTGRTSHGRGSNTERTNNHYNDYANTEVVDQGGYQYPQSILTFARPKLPKGMGHPTQKPVALMEWLTKTYTNEGDLILDNVAGVASTLVAARTCGRRAIGIEADESYIEKAIARLESGSEGDKW